MEKEKLLEEIVKYIEVHNIFDKYDDIVMNQEMKEILNAVQNSKKSDCV